MDGSSMTRSFPNRSRNFAKEYANEVPYICGPPRAHPNLLMFGGNWLDVWNHVDNWGNDDWSIFPRQLFPRSSLWRTMRPEASGRCSELSILTGVDFLPLINYPALFASLFPEIVTPALSSRNGSALNGLPFPVVKLFQRRKREYLSTAGWVLEFSITRWSLETKFVTSLAFTSH